MDEPTFTIVTPVMNGAAFLPHAIRSISDQTLASWEHVIVDGGSTDGSREIATEAAKRDPRICLVFEPDKGMYDALVKGLRMGRGRYLGWLNADDMLMPWAFATVGRAFDGGRRWVTGLPAFWNEGGELFWVDAPTRYPRSLVRRGLFHGRALGWIQQESTFFTRELFQSLDPADVERIRASRLAGDFLLWTRFARLAQLQPLPTVISGFRYHRKNMSLDKSRYYREVRSYGYWVPPPWMLPAFLPLRASLRAVGGLRRAAAWSRVQRTRLDDP